MVGNNPAPSCPAEFKPQQYISRSTVTPHVCRPPVAMSMNLWPPVTRVGAARSTVVPSPTWPNSFGPQQYASLSVGPTALRPSRQQPKPRRRKVVVERECVRHLTLRHCREAHGVGERVVLIGKTLEPVTYSCSF